MHEWQVDGHTSWSISSEAREPRGLCFKLLGVLGPQQNPRPELVSPLPGLVGGWGWVGGSSERRGNRVGPPEGRVVQENMAGPSAKSHREPREVMKQETSLPWCCDKR